MPASYLTGALLLVIMALGLDAQELSQPTFDQLRGVVNRYLEVTDAIPCLRTVRVADSATILASGDRVVMIQMQGADIITQDDPTYGAITDLNGAGSMEYLTVERVSGDSVLFTAPWVHTYETRGRVQLVRVSRHVDAQVVSTVVPQPWNGRTGGVVAIDVDKTLSLDADVSATARGFRGGSVSVKKDICNNQVWTATLTSGEGGQKGENISSSITGQDVCAKGSAANGGGGGNGANAGGAGGGGGGRGGNGGDASSLCDPYIGSGGRAGGGLATHVAKQRLFMGGGGGGGHQNNNQGTAGANGGGIVMIRAQIIVATTGKLMSQGETVRDTSAWRNGVALEPGDGTGGGGAGGSVMVEAQQVIGAMTINVRGGNGGHVGARYQPNGPGGGGGGGIALIPRPNPNITVIAAGGSPGVHVSFETGPNVFRRPWGATAGDSGIVVTPFSWRMPTDPTLSIVGADTVCDGNTVVLTASDGFASYRWSTGESGRVINVGLAGRYAVTATDSAGCVRPPLSVEVGVRNALIVAGPDVNFGTTEVGANLRSSFVIRNVNTESFSVSQITLPPDVRIIGNAPPIVVLPGDSARVDLEFLASRVMSLRDSIRLEVNSPCKATAFVRTSADVTADRVVFTLPQVSTARPAELVTIPIQARLETPTADIRGVGLRLVVGIDARLFDAVTARGATITSTTLDRARSLRLIELTFSSVEITQLSSVIADLDGTTLLAGVTECPITIEQAVWNRPFGGPATRSDTGRLSVGMPCGSSRRAVRFLGRERFQAHPNPADDVVTIDLGESLARGLSWTVMDALGMNVAVGVFAGPTSSTVTIQLPHVASGTYMLRLVADEGSMNLPLIIQR
jgi:hypothetical protein